VVTKCDERAKQAAKFGSVVIIENRRKSEATKFEAAKVEVLLYVEDILISLCKKRFRSLRRKEEITMETEATKNP
jgi:hypothetical protein